MRVKLRHLPRPPIAAKKLTKIEELQVSINRLVKLKKSITDLASIEHIDREIINLNRQQYDLEYNFKPYKKTLRRLSA
jgi:hypothetical protein